LQHDPSLIYIWQAVEVPEVREKTEVAMWESARALITAYPDDFTEANLSEHIADLLRRFENRALGDTIFRVGRDLPRKLSREDRVIGAMRFDELHGVAYPVTAQVAAAAIAFRGVDELGRPAPSDEKFATEIYPLGLEAILTRTCGLDLSDPIDANVAAAVRAACMVTEVAR